MSNEPSNEPGNQLSRELKYYHDPDGSKMRKRERRIDELMAQAGGNEAALGRAYFELVHDNEDAPMTTDFAELTAAGFEFPPAASLDDDALEARLDELVAELERMHVELYGAETRSPRELYTLLTERHLHEEHADVPMAEGSKWVVDVMSPEAWEEETGEAPMR